MTPTFKALATVEILQDIAGKLDPVSLVAATQVCRFWKDACEPLLWSTLSSSDWGLILQHYQQQSQGHEDGDWPFELPAPHLVHHIQLHSGINTSRLPCARSCRVRGDNEQQHAQQKKPAATELPAGRCSSSLSSSGPSCLLPTTSCTVATRMSPPTCSDASAKSSSLQPTTPRALSSGQTSSPSTTIPTKTWKLASSDLTAIVQSCRHLQSLEIHTSSYPYVGWWMPFFQSSQQQLLLEGIPLSLLADRAVLGSLSCLESLNLSADQVILSYSNAKGNTCNSPKGSVVSKQPLANVERLVRACPQLRTLALRGPIFSLAADNTDMDSDWYVGGQGTDSAQLRQDSIAHPRDNQFSSCGDRSARSCLKEQNKSAAASSLRCTSNSFSSYSLDRTLPCHRPTSTYTSNQLATRAVISARPPSKPSRLQTVRLNDMAVLESDLLRFLQRYGQRVETLDLSEAVCWRWSTKKKGFVQALKQACPRIRALKFSCTKAPFTLTSFPFLPLQEEEGDVVQEDGRNAEEPEDDERARPVMALADDQLAEVIRAFPDLEAFSARACYVGDRTLAALVASCQLASSLRVLDLSLTRKGILQQSVAPSSAGAGANGGGSIDLILSKSSLHLFLCHAAPNLERLDAEGLYIQLTDLLHHDQDDDNGAPLWACSQRLESLNIGFSLSSTALSADNDGEEQQRQQWDAAWRFLSTLPRLKHLKIAHTTVLDLSLGGETSSFSSSTAAGVAAAVAGVDVEEREQQGQQQHSECQHRSKTKSRTGFARLTSLKRLETLDLETCGLKTMLGQREMHWMGSAWRRLRVLIPGGAYRGQETKMQQWLHEGRRCRHCSCRSGHQQDGPAESEGESEEKDRDVEIRCPPNGFW